ncbi:MAG TPA: FtsX-like permease family protein [Candidatus Limnocylindrales bacterium]
MSLLRYVLANLVAYRSRLVFTAAAVALGVGSVAGTLILVDTAPQAGRSPGNLYADVVVRAGNGGEVVADTTGEVFAGRPIPAAQVDVVAQVEGVAAAVGVVTGEAQLIGRDGHVVPGRRHQGRSVAAPTPDGLVAGRAPEVAGSGDVVGLVAGRVPAGPGEVVVDSLTADGEGWRVGERVRVVTARPGEPFGTPRTFTVVGLLDSRRLPNLVVVGFDRASAAEWLTTAGEVTFIEVRLRAGAGPQPVRDRVAAALGPGYEAFTAASLVAERAGTAVTFAAVVGGAAAVVALFTGGLVIRNTYTIVLASRRRELALLRCAGASPRQLGRMVLLEAAFVGALASVAGVALGAAVAWVLGRMLAGELVALSAVSAGLRITPRTVAVAFAAGMLFAALSAWLPARRAAKVPPVVALRDDPYVLTGRAGRVRAVAGTVLAVAGALLSPANIGVGAAILTLGVLVLCPVLAWQLGRLAGAVAGRIRGVAATLAAGNAVRSPRRTAATVLPLVVGLALAGFLATVAAGAKAAQVGDFDRTIRADFRIRSTGFGTMLDPDVAQRLSGLPELETVAAFKGENGTVAGRETFLASADPAALARVTSPPLVAGSLTDLRDGGIGVSREAAAAANLTLGSVVPVKLSGDEQQLTVQVIYDIAGLSEVVRYDQLPFADFVITPADYRRLGGGQALTAVLATARGGDLAAARATMARATIDHPTAEITDREQLRRSASADADSPLPLLYGLLGLAAVIGLFSIANTLALSIVERTRELGLLRAIGMDRRQLRSMIRWEAALTAGIGVAIGLGLGTFLGWATTVARNLPAAAVPLGQLTLFAAGAVVAAIVATTLTAHRTARVDLLRAITDQ